MRPPELILPDDAQEFMARTKAKLEGLFDDDSVDHNWEKKTPKGTPEPATSPPHETGAARSTQLSTTLANQTDLPKKASESKDSIKDHDPELDNLFDEQFWQISIVNLPLCEQIAAVDKALKVGREYGARRDHRQHLQSCDACRTSYANVVQVYDRYDRTSLSTLGELFRQLKLAINMSGDRVNGFVSAEPYFVGQPMADSDEEAEALLARI